MNKQTAKKQGSKKTEQKRSAKNQKSIKLDVRKIKTPVDLGTTDIKIGDGSTVKVTAKSTREPAEKKRTIKTVVIETLAADSQTCNTDMIAAVKKEFPKSAFDEKHASWYRSQARKGLLTGSPIAIPSQKVSKKSALK
jgi:hypothetical protein